MYYSIYTLSKFNMNNIIIIINENKLKTAKLQ